MGGIKPRCWGHHHRFSFVIEMRRILVIAALLCRIASTSYAHTYVIPKAGLSVSKFALAENNDNISTLAGFTAGAALNIKVGSKFSFQPELLFIQKGGSATFKQNIGDGILQTTTTDVTVNYLELPLLAKAMFGNGKIQYYVNAGPSIGYGLGGKTDYALNWNLGGEIVYEESAKGEVRFGNAPAEYQAQHIYFKERIDIGVQFGGGVFVASKVLVDFRYGLGLNKLDDESQPKNRTFQVTVGVPIFLFDK
jgi:hypothetical protein